MNAELPAEVCELEDVETVKVESKLLVLDLSPENESVVCYIATQVAI